MLRLLFIFYIFATPVYGQDLVDQLIQEQEVQEDVPDINQLTVGWWEYFEVPPDQLPKKIDNFENNLIQLSLNFSPQTQKTANAITEKIVLNLRTYGQNLKRPLSPPPQPGPIANDYSIDDIVRLHQLLNKQKTELQTLDVQRADKQQQLSTAEELLSETKSSYAKAENRSEKRLMAGLEIVALRSLVEVLQQSLSFLEQSKQVQGLSVEHTEEELTVAVNRMISSDLDLFLYAQKAKQEDEEWEESESVLKRYQAMEAAALSETVGEEEDENYLKLVQETDQAEINEIIASNHYIFSLIQFHLAQLLSDPEKIDYYDLQHKIEDWQKKLTLFKSKIGEWSGQADRLLQRVGQILAQNGKNQKKEYDKLTPIQQEILELAQENLVLIQRLENEINDSQFLLDILNQRTSQKIGGSRFWLRYTLDTIKTGYSKTIYWLTRELVTIGKNPITLLNILEFFLIIIFTIWISKILLTTLTRFAHQRKGIKKSLVYRVSRLIYYLLLTVGLLIALSAIGFDFSNFVLIAGALGVGIGFGLQSIFNNFISGIIILFESHLKVGDYIELESGIKGEVREINVRSTVITDNDGIDVLVPNSEIIGNKVLNWTLKVPYRRFHIPFTVAYGTDKDLLAKLVVDAAKKVPHTLTKLGIPDPVVRLNKLGDYGMEFELVVWVTEKYTKRTRTTRSDYLWVVETTLAKHNIIIPYPQLELRVHKEEGFSPK
jgi:potassium-dependent mechanosensitive channel